MSYSVPQQITELLNRSKKSVLVTTGEHPDLDAVCSATAFAFVLRAMGKTYDLVLPASVTESWPSFLGKPECLRTDLGAMRAFHVRIDVSKTPLSELMYDVREGVLDVTLIPKTGSWTPQDVSMRYGDDRYDCIVAFGAPDQASLGALARDYADFLYRTTLVNIDHSPTNEHWGQINLVDMNTVAVSEVLSDWIAASNITLTEPVATALLTGMIAKTKSFRTAQVGNKTMQVAATLMQAGARRDEIQRGLWRTRSVPVLKLWGRALSRLEQDRTTGLVWSTLSAGDFVEAGCSPDALEGVVDELLSYAPEAKTIVLMWQDRERINVSVHTQPPVNAAELARPFSGTGTRTRAIFTYQEQKPLHEATQDIIERIRKTLTA